MLQKWRRVQIKGATIGRLWAIWLVLSAVKSCSESCVCKFLHLHFYCLPNCSFQFLNMAWNISFTLQNCYFKRFLHVFHRSHQFGNKWSPSLPNRDPLAFQVTQGVHLHLYKCQSPAQYIYCCATFPGRLRGLWNKVLNLSIYIFTWSNFGSGLPSDPLCLMYHVNLLHY